MTSQSTKAKRRKIPAFTLKELEDAGKIPPFTYLMDRLDNWSTNESEFESGKNSAESQIRE